MSITFDDLNNDPIPKAVLSFICRLTDRGIRSVLGDEGGNSKEGSMSWFDVREEDKRREVELCTKCGKEVIMTPHRKMMRRRNIREGKSQLTFCDRVCNTQYYNEKMKEERRLMKAWRDA